MWAITPTEDRLFLASPPFVEIMSLECDAPEAAFEWQDTGLLVQFTNTSSSWWTNPWLVRRHPDCVEQLWFKHGESNHFGCGKKR